MNNILYRRTVVNAKDSVDGEYPTTINVTQENNGYLVVIDSHDGGHELLKWFPSVVERDAAIEYAVNLQLKGLNPKHFKHNWND